MSLVLLVGLCAFGLVTFAMRDPSPPRPRVNRLGLPADRTWRF